MSQAMGFLYGGAVFRLFFCAAALPGIAAGCRSEAPDTKTAAPSALVRADAELRAGRLQEAEQLYRKILETRPEEVIAAANLVYVLERQNRPREAEQFRPIREKADRYTELLSRGIIAELQHDYQDSASLLVRARELSAAEPMAARVLARSYINLGKYAEALDLLLPLYEQYSGEAFYMIKLASAQLGAGRLEAVLKTVEAAESLEMSLIDRAWLVSQEMRALVQLDRGEAAIAEGQGFIKQYGEAPMPILFALARAYERLGSFAEAADFYERSEQLQPGTGPEDKVEELRSKAAASK